MLDTDGTDLIAVAAVASALLAEWQHFSKVYEERHGVSTEDLDGWVTKGAKFSDVLKLIIQSSQMMRIVGARPPSFTYADFRSLLERVLGSHRQLSDMPFLSKWAQFWERDPAVKQYKISKEGKRIYISKVILLCHFQLTKTQIFKGLTYEQCRGIWKETILGNVHDSDNKVMNES